MLSLKKIKTIGNGEYIIVEGKGTNFQGVKMVSNEDFLKGKVVFDHFEVEESLRPYRKA